MRKIGEILRLKAAGLNIRDIARSTGAGRTTVYEYLARAEAAGLSWPLPADMDEATLETKLFPPPSLESAAARPVPDWREVNRELKRHRHVTLRLLWLEWKRAHPEGWGYSQFCAHYQRWLGAQDLVMRLEYAAGERLFVDFAGDKMSIVEGGVVTPMEIFVSVLGASGMLYAEAVRGQDLESWLLAHARAYEFYGGVARVTVPDNLKSGVTKACWYDPEINPSYLQLARVYDTIILPTRTARPRDKAACEVGVQVVERWVIAPLRNRRFFSSGELNRAIRANLDEVNGREFRGQPSSRRDLFLELERPALQPLPATRYELTEIKKATVNIDYHVEFTDQRSRRFYSVPYQLVRQKVEVWATASTIEIYHRHRRVASHVREYGRRRYITDPAHMPASHRAHLEWTPSRLIKWAGTISPASAELAERILLSKPHPEHGYRACLGLMNLAKRYGRERVAAACARALASNAISYTSIKSILAHNLDRQPLPAAQLSLVPPPPTHSNLRGADYYRVEQEA
jgi:transposase